MSSLISAHAQIPAFKNFVVTSASARLLTDAGVVTGSTLAVGTILKDMGTTIYLGLPSPLGTSSVNGTVLRKVAVFPMASGTIPTTGYVQIAGVGAPIAAHTGLISRLN
jgi:hypothetical protein